MIARGMRRLAAAFAMGAGILARPTHAQAPRAGRLVADTLHSKSIAGNKYGDSPDRSVLVYLPPSYDSAASRRYPVVYLLHGFGGTERSWIRGYNFRIDAAMDSLIAAAAVREMIIVMPNALTRFGGSFYTNSAATGAWDDLIARELVGYIDGKYRTIARAEGRGLAGHSMGGFGAFAVGMRHAGDVYAAVYSLSGCCTRFAREVNPASPNPVWLAISQAQSLEAAQALAFYPKVSLALAAAFAPDTSKGPLFIRMPFELREGKWMPVPSVLDQWAANAPFDMIPAHAQRLKRLRALAFDVGTRDQLVPLAGLAAMDTAFTRAGVPHTFETYDGDHSSGVGVRMITRVLPFFSRALDFSPQR